MFFSFSFLFWTTFAAVLNYVIASHITLIYSPEEQGQYKLPVSGLIKLEVFPMQTMAPGSLALHSMDWSQWSMEEIKRIDPYFIEQLPLCSANRLAETYLNSVKDKNYEFYDSFITDVLQSSNEQAENADEKIFVIPEALIATAAFFASREIAKIIITNIRNNVENDVNQAIENILSPEMDVKFSFDPASMLEYFGLSGLQSSDDGQKAVWLGIFSFSTTSTLLYKALRYCSMFPFVRLNAVAQEYIKSFESVVNRPITGCLKFFQCICAQPVPERNLSMSPEERISLMAEINTFIDMIKKHGALFSEDNHQPQSTSSKKKPVYDVIDGKQDVSMEFEIVTNSKQESSQYPASSAPLPPKPQATTTATKTTRNDYYPVFKTKDEKTSLKEKKSKNNKK